MIGDDCKHGRIDVDLMPIGSYRVWVTPPHGQCRFTVLGSWPTFCDAVKVGRFAIEQLVKPQPKLIKPPTQHQLLSPWYKEAKRRRLEAAKHEVKES